jgi:hypothetical protein
MEVETVEEPVEQLAIRVDTMGGRLVMERRGFGGMWRSRKSGGRFA